METMEVHGVRMIAAIAEMDADAVALSGPDGGTRNAAVVRPCGVFDAWNDFDVFIKRDNFVFTEGLSVWQCGYLTVIKICQDVCWIEAILLVIYFTDCVGHDAIMIVKLHGWRGQDFGIACT